VSVRFIAGSGGVPNVNANSLFGNNTGSTAPGFSLSAAQVLTLLGISSGTMLNLLTSGIPFIYPASGNIANNGVWVMGVTPANSATVSFSASSGSGVTMTFSAAALLGTASDNGRVLTILDTTYKQVTITAFSTTTVATVTIGTALSGTGPFANANMWLTGANPLPSLSLSLNQNGYILLPTGAIFAGSAAGWYYIQLASTTQGTLFNNTYSSGLPVVPGSPTAFSTTGPGAYTATTAGTNGPALTINANVIGINGRLELYVLADYSNTANQKNVQGLLGAQLFGGQFNNTANNQQIPMLFSITNRGVANKQSFTENNIGVGGVDSAASQTAPSRGAGIDTTSNQTLAITTALTTASSDWVVLESYSIKLFPSSP
jgi:hypothetical protein